MSDWNETYLVLDWLRVKDRETWWLGRAKVNQLHTIQYNYNFILLSQVITCVNVWLHGQSCCVAACSMSTSIPVMHVHMIFYVN